MNIIRVQNEHKHRVKLEQHVPDGILEIKCDGQRLKQILINLVKNASKFTFEGFIRLTVRKT